MSRDPEDGQYAAVDAQSRGPARATVDRRGRFILPASVTRRLGVIPGEQLVVDVAEHALRVRRPVSSLARIYVEPTTRCNMDCAMCQRRGWSGGVGDMAPEIIERILEGIAACRPRPTVVLGGFGEPLMHDGLMDFIEQVRDLGAGIELITNGLLLDEDRVQRLRQLDLDRLWLSVDGGTEPCHGHAMDREDFAHLVQTLWRSDTIHHFPLGRKLRLGLVFVAMKSNVRQLPKVMGLARRLHAGRVLISNLLPYDSDVSKEVLYAKSMWNTPSDHLQVRIPRVDLGEGVLESLAQHNEEDCLGNPFPTCGACLWAQGLILCP